MLVFRDGRRAVSGPARRSQLVSVLQSGLPGRSPHPALLLDALLRAGELECAISDDAAHSAVASDLACIGEITDALASASLGDVSQVTRFRDRLENLSVPDPITVSAPEGFAYYGLHPLNYADVAGALASRRTAVLGIRSIGTTLSAVVAAAVRRCGLPVSRITVRPQGHPFDRHLDFQSEQAAWVSRECHAGSEFWVVDEGPGLSGSSFLSVGEALQRAGVPVSRILFLCAVEPVPQALCAREARTRWQCFRVKSVKPPWRRPADAVTDVSGGQWRVNFMGESCGWPGSWVQFERLKFLSPSRNLLYKFEGFGRFGSDVAARAQTVADAGFGPPPRTEQDGFYSYPVIPGRVARVADASSDVLDRIAAYCAFRAAAFRTHQSDQRALEHMLAWNYQEEFGEELDPSFARLPMELPVFVDGRTQPHEWVVTERLSKTDNAGHGEDHFFPGPTDIAWDLAGTIVEWQLEPAATQHLLSRYCERSGDDVRGRLRNYLLAYTMFRVGYCRMAAEAMSGNEESVRLRRDYQRYRTAAAELTARAVAA